MVRFGGDFGLSFLSFRLGPIPCDCKSIWVKLLSNACYPVCCFACCWIVWVCGLFGLVTRFSVLSEEVVKLVRHRVARFCAS